MIVPLEDERAWLLAFRTLPNWRPSSSPMVVIAPHPDDETLGAGGLIAQQRARGVEVRVVAVTDGENAYPDFDGLGALRRMEQEQALEQLGIPLNKVQRLHLPDSNVASHEQALVHSLLPLVARDTHIVAPWSGDFHPDHEACGRAAEEVARRTGATLSYYFFWAWHRGSVSLLNRLSLSSFALDEDCIARKARALECHHSQLVRASGDPILPESLLAPARRPFEVYLTA